MVPCRSTFLLRKVSILMDRHDFQIFHRSTVTMYDVNEDMPDIKMSGVLHVVIIKGCPLFSSINKPSYFIRSTQ